MNSLLLPRIAPPPGQVRHELERGHAVRYLLPDAVLRYIHAHGLYGTAALKPRLLHWADKQVDSEQD